MFGTFPSDVTISSRRSQVTGCDTLSVSLVLPNTITFATYFTMVWDGRKARRSRSNPKYHCLNEDIYLSGGDADVEMLRSS